MTIESASLARSRAWAPLGLMLVLACGAWFFGGTARQDSPGVPPTANGWIRPGPGEPGQAGAARTPAGDALPGAQGAGPDAPQVLEEVAQRGRQAPPAMAPTSSPLSAEALQAQVRRDAAAVHRQTAGQRLRLQGTLASVEAGEPGVLVLHLALAGEAGTVRVVASPSLAQAAANWAPPRAVALDCLSQGVMMGEWLLVDCRE